MKPEEKLREEFGTFLQELTLENGFDKKGELAMKKIKEICKRRLVELNQDLLERQNAFETVKEKTKLTQILKANFKCGTIKPLFGKSEAEFEQRLDKFLKPLTYQPFIRFIYGFSDSRHYISDLCSLCLGKDGFNKYVEIKGKEKPIPKQLTTSPLEEPQLKELFQQKCFLFAYNEDIAQPEQSTTYKDINFPSIDILFISYNAESDAILIENVENRVNHGKGIIRWKGEKKKAIEISFPHSPRGLNLSFHTSELAEDLPVGAINLLLGHFSYVDHQKGNLITGNLVLKQPEENEDLRTMKPTVFEYSLDTFAPKQEDETSPKVPKEILMYLFDRYRNWHKIKGGIQNFEEFKTWVKGKREKEYLRKNITEYQYFVTCPISSFTDTKKQEEISEALENTFTNFKENHKITKEVRSKIKSDKELKAKFKTWEEKKKYLIKEIAANLQKDENKFKLFPLENLDVDDGDTKGLNEKLFDGITKSVSVVIIIPDEEYKKKSSIYTIAGYALALRKKTFILHQNADDLPIVINSPAQSMGLNVWKYEDLREIPFLFYYKDRHNQRFKKPNHTE